MGMHSKGVESYMLRICSQSKRDSKGSCEHPTVASYHLSAAELEQTEVPPNDHLASHSSAPLSRTVKPVLSGHRIKQTLQHSPRVSA